MQEPVADGECPVVRCHRGMAPVTDPSLEVRLAVWLWASVE